MIRREYDREQAVQLCGRLEEKIEQLRERQCWLLEEKRIEQTQFTKGSLVRTTLSLLCEAKGLA